MPRYFFDTVDGGVDVDAEGLELADDHAAVLEGIRYAGSLLNDDPSIWLKDQKLVVTVRSRYEVVEELQLILRRSF